MKIQQFDGGLVTRLRPQFLELNQGTVYNNIDNALGTLSSVKSKLATDILAGLYNYYFSITDTWYSSDVRRDYVEYQGNLYWTDGSQPTAVINGNELRLGIVAPTSRPIVTTSDTLDSVNTAKFDVTQAGNLPLETTYYKLVNSDGEYYSDAQDFSVNLANSKVGILGTDYEDKYSNFGPVVPATASVVFNAPEGVEYGSGGIELYRQYNNEWRLVGTFTDPGVGPIQGITDDVVNIGTNPLLDEAKIAPINGTVQYLYTFYNSTNGVESAPSLISTAKNVQGIVQLSNLQVSQDTQVDKKRIYRVGGFLSTFTLVDEIDNNETTYLDTLKDTEVEGDLLDSTLNSPAPSGLKYLTESNAMLFGAEGSKLRFTPIGKPFYWPEVYYLEFYSDITGIGETGSGLLVFTKYKTYIVYGTGPTLLSKQLLDGEQGCVSNASVQQVGSAVMWLSTDGICASNGSPAEVITQASLGKVELDVIDSVVHDQVYYLMASNGEVLAYDYRFSRVFKKLSLGIRSFAVGKDTLYGVANGVLHELFAGDELEEFTYTSPRFIEGRFSEDKTYKKVYIYSAGDIIINIFINDSLVFNTTLTGTKKHEIQIDQALQRGNYIQIELKGKGEVFEYEYVVGRGLGHAGV